MPDLCVNIDHVATLRQARGEELPEPLEAAELAERAGACGITVHLREDRRHIQERDVWLLRRRVRGKLNLEMALTPELLALARRLRPDEATLVPERRRERTTEGGLEVAGDLRRVARGVERLKAAGIAVSLFIMPQPRQIRAAAAAGADLVELHTGPYAQAFRRGGPRAARRELERLRSGAELAAELGLKLNAGHGLTYDNVGPVARLPRLLDLNIGHNIVARAVMVGMSRAVREMLWAIKGKRP